MKRHRLRWLASSWTCAGSGNRNNFISLIIPGAWLRKRRLSLLAPALGPTRREGRDETGLHELGLTSGSGLQPCRASRRSRAPQPGGRASRLRPEPRPESLAALRGAGPGLARYV